MLTIIRPFVLTLAAMLLVAWLARAQDTQSPTPAPPPQESLSSALDRLCKVYEERIYYERESHARNVSLLSDAVIQLIERTGKTSIELDDEKRAASTGPPFPVPVRHKSGEFIDWLETVAADRALTLSEPRNGKRTWSINR